ncbi:gp2 [Clostridium baratii]|nr:gp2 [Clostridium baratii]
MKAGIRIPSIKKSISVRTTGKFNRAVKSYINPLYRKK